MRTANVQPHTVVYELPEARSVHVTVALTGGVTGSRNSLGTRMAESV